MNRGPNVVDARESEGWTVYELAAQRSADILRHMGRGMIIHDTMT